MRPLSRGLPSLRFSAFELQGHLCWAFPMLLLLTIITPNGVHAADASSAPPIALEADLGFHGYYAPGYLTPVRVRLANQGSTVAGQLIISQSAETPQGQVRTVQIVQELTLPQGAHQRYELEFPIFSQRESLISEPQLQLILQAEGRTLAQKTISLRDYDHAFERLNLSLSEAPAPAKLPSGQPLLPVDLPQLPNHWSGYQGVQQLYLGRFNLSNLSAGQRQALRDWLNSGGELIVLLGGNWYFQQDRALDELLPFAPHEVQPGQVDGRPAQIAVGQAQGAVLISSDSGIPLLIRGRFGRGTVYAVTVDLFGLASGPQEEALWQGLSSSPDDDALPANLGAELLGNLRLEEPSRPILAGLLTLYLVGFALLGMLKGRHRRLLGAIPLWAALISLGLLSYLQQPVFTHPLRSIEVGRIWVRGDQAFIQDWYGAFARRGAELKLHVDDQAAVSQTKASHDLTANVTSGQGSVQLTLASQETSHLQLAEPIRFPVKFQVRPAGPDASAPLIDVYNESDQELAQAIVWWQGQLYTVGTVGAHEHVNRTLPAPLGSRRPTDAGEKSESLLKQRLWSEAESALSTETTLFAWVRQERFAPVSDEYRTAVQLVSVIGR